MKKPFEDDWDELRTKVLGLGESSLHRRHPGVGQRLVEVERFRALANLTGDLLLIVDAGSGRILEVNETVCHQAGKSREELLSAGFSDTFGNAAWDALLRGRDSGRDGDSVIATELSVGAERVPVEILARFITTRARCHAVLAIRDITERLRTEAVLREQAATLAHASRVAHLGTGIWDWRRNCVRFSPELCRILGMPESEEEHPIEDFYRLVVPADRERVRQAVAAAREQGYLNTEFRFVRENDKAERFAHAIGEVMPEDSGSSHLLGALQDITARKRLEQQFHQAQKLESIGRLAGGVAHDFNNLLTVIQGYSEMALNGMSPQAPLYMHLTEIRKAGERARGLTEQLLAFSRRQVAELRPVSLNEIVRDMEKMLRRLIGEDVELVVELAAALDPVMADSGQITQMIMNLAVNARDAMPDGGRLIIKTSHVDLDESQVAGQPGVQPGSYVSLAVSDTGTGMNEETQAHIFEPFYTTKPKGAGTGLGLATVYGVVTQSRGCIYVDSEVGKGTTFRICLPVTESVGSRAAETAPSAARLRGTETVLIVEDQAEVRALIARGLRNLDYTVLEAASGRGALLVCERHQGPIHVMVTDVVMPGMNGREVVERLAPSHPELKVLYMSGYTDTVIARQGVLEEGIDYIAKPFTPGALAARIRLLAGAETGPPARRSAPAE